jgi:hypothetical protein
VRVSKQGNEEINIEEVDLFAGKGQAEEYRIFESLYGAIRDSYMLNEFLSGYFHFESISVSEGMLSGIGGWYFGNMKSIEQLKGDLKSLDERLEKYLAFQCPYCNEPASINPMTQCGHYSDPA